MRTYHLAVVLMAALAFGQTSQKFKQVDSYITNGVYNTAMFNFPAKIPSVSAERTLTAAVGATVTFTAAMGGCPMGVSGANVGHYLYISGGVGTAEAVLLTGGTCTSGAASGTVTFTPANNHSGAWNFTSATAGIYEAIAVAKAYNSSAGARVFIPSGSYTQYASINATGLPTGFEILGAGRQNTTITCKLASAYPCLDSQGWRTHISSFQIIGDPAGSQTAAIRIGRSNASGNSDEPKLDLLSIQGTFSKVGIANISADEMELSHSWIRGPSSVFIGVTDVLGVGSAFISVCSSCANTRNLIINSELIAYGAGGFCVQNDAGSRSFSMLQNFCSAQGSGIQGVLKLTDSGGAGNVPNLTMLQNDTELGANNLTFRYVDVETSAGSGVRTGEVTGGLGGATSGSTITYIYLPAATNYWGASVGLYGHAGDTYVAGGGYIIGGSIKNYLDLNATLGSSTANFVYYCTACSGTGWAHPRVEIGNNVTALCGTLGCVQANNEGRIINFTRDGQNQITASGASAFLDMGVRGTTLLRFLSATSLEQEVALAMRIGGLLGTITHANTGNRTYTLSDLTGTLPITGTPTLNHASCWKTATAGPPPVMVLGYCSDVVSATGTCTCN